MEASSILDELWVDLKHGFEQIFAHEDISKQRFMQLYTNVYNYCKSVLVDSSITGNMSVAQFVGGQLYIRVDLFLNGQVKKILDNSSSLEADSQILSYYATQWANYTASCKHLNQICSFLNKNWIKKEVEEQRIDIKDVYELALTKWRKVVFDGLKGKVTSACLSLIEKSRNGEKVDLGEVKIALGSYVDLGQTLKPTKKLNLSLYRSAFESAFLAETERYFLVQSNLILNSEADFIELLTIAEEKLDEERRRARSYLHESTAEALRSCGEKVLLKGHEKFRAKSFDGSVFEAEECQLPRTIFCKPRI